MRVEILYIERKSGLSGPARIGRVTRTKSGRGVYYGGRLLRAMRGGGFKFNYVDAETGDEYWISRPRKDGQDRLYPGVVEIEEDAREEYWTVVRRRPDLIGETRFRSEGKYSSRRAAGTMRRDKGPAAAADPAEPCAPEAGVHDVPVTESAVDPLRK